MRVFWWTAPPVMSAARRDAPMIKQWNARSIEAFIFARGGGVEAAALNGIGTNCGIFGSPVPGDIAGVRGSRLMRGCFMLSLPAR